MMNIVWGKNRCHIHDLARNLQGLCGIPPDMKGSMETIGHKEGLAPLIGHGDEMEVSLAIE